MLALQQFYRKCEKKNENGKGKGKNNCGLHAKTAPL